MEKPEQERRQIVRMPVSIDASWVGISGRYEARVVNMSLVGCYLESSGRVLNREQLDVELQTPDGELLRLRGEVVYRIPESGFGVYFPNMDNKTRQLIARLVEHYAQAGAG